MLLGRMGVQNIHHEPSNRSKIQYFFTDVLKLRKQDSIKTLTYQDVQGDEAGEDYYSEEDWDSSDSETE